ncbi:peptidoglycan-binding domain-containing protein [Streptomyces sp. UG1]|uniref:peptidoglycan-binding domain-containing protein n=1 Tax=Streptomyces sp. UG1 TaxID=3417652 RepID=UPI003CE6B3DA
MRANALTRTVVSLTAVIGLAAGSLATAGASFAAQDTKPAASSEVTILAVNNLGLTNAEAKKVQRVLKQHWGYRGSIDGLLGTNSWKAMQKWLTNWGYPSNQIDGIVGPNTIKALQKWLKARYGYNGAIDGIAGSKTKAAFKRMANACPNCP